MTPGLARVSSIGGANMLSTTLAMRRPGGEAEGRSASRPSRRPRTSVPVRSTSHDSSSRRCSCRCTSPSSLGSETWKAIEPSCGPRSRSSRSPRWGVRTRPPPPSLTRNLDREEFEQAVRFKNPSVVTVMALANQYLATGRDAEGHTYFCKRATEVPDRAVFGALCGMFQVRMSSTVPALQRSDWVKDGMAKLDRAAASDGLSRYLRGVVSAELPEGFGRAQQATEDLEWVLAHPQPFPRGIRRAAYVGLSHAYRTLGKTEASQRALAQSGSASSSPPAVTDFSVNARWLSLHDSGAGPGRAGRPCRPWLRLRRNRIHRNR